MIIQLHFDEHSMAVYRQQIENGGYDIPRYCHKCGAIDSVISHGRRKRTCLGIHNNTITVRRGRCKECLTTFTFLPSFAKPNTQYSVNVVQETLMAFINNRYSLYDSLPVLNIMCGWPPDLKTPFNWLHVVFDRIKALEFNVVPSNSSMKRLVMVTAEETLGKVTASMQGIIGKFHSTLSIIAKGINSGAHVAVQGLLFNAENFFQALFTAFRGKVIAWKY